MRTLMITNGDDAAYANEYNVGLTKRELFAAMAMQGLTANLSQIAMSYTAIERAELAVINADALILALNKEVQS